MQMNNIRLITQKELDSVNPKLCKEFGALNKIASGSCVDYEGNQKRYYITLIDSTVYKQVPMLKKIGAIVKNIWGAEEVFYLGIKIA